MAIVITRKASPKYSVKNEIHRRLAGWESPRPHFPLRASDLMGDQEFCPREHAFLDMKVGKKKASFVGTALRMTFNHGNFMEKQIRNNFLRDMVVGNWECPVCAVTHPTFGKVPQENCPKCHSPWEYQEPRFPDAYTGISGGVDMLLDIGGPKLLVVELKTIAPDNFKELLAPLAEHKFRTSLYLKLVEESKLPISASIDTTEARILYVTKSFGVKDTTLKELGIKDAPFSPFKEFTILRDDSLAETVLRKARVLQVWRETKQGMPCGICYNGLVKRAQECSAISGCFTGKHPSTLTWLKSDSTPYHPGKQVVS